MTGTQNDSSSPADQEATASDEPLGAVVAITAPQMAERWKADDATFDPRSDGAEAIRWARRAASTTEFKHIPALEALAAAYAEARQFDRSVTLSRRALTIARESGDNDAAARIEERLMFFEDGKPYHEPARSH